MTLVLQALLPSIPIRRGYERLAVRIEPSLQSIVDELEDGRPVLVLQNLGIRLFPIWHYAVVVGYDSDSQSFVLRSGSTRRRIMKYNRFARTWRSADNWGLVILRPGELPASRDHHAYASAVASLETMQRHESARVAYQAGLQRWEDGAVLMLGYANALHGLNDLHAAVGAYRWVLSKYPRNIPAANNLAQTLGELGCKDQALEVVDGIFPAAAKSKFAAALATTRSSLIEAQRSTCPLTDFGTHKRAGVISELSAR